MKEIKESYTLNKLGDELIEIIKNKVDFFSTMSIVFPSSKMQQWFKTYWLKTQSDILYSYDIDLSSVDNVVEKYGYIVVSGRISVRKDGTIKSIKSKLKIPKYFEGIDRLTIILLNK